MSGSHLTPSPALQALLHSDIPAVRQAARLAMRGRRLPRALSQVPEGGAVAGSVAAPSVLAPVPARARVLLSMVCEAHRELPATEVERLIRQEHGRR
jgi:hypothetical protein